MSVNISNFTLFFFEQACHANLVQTRNERDQVHIFQYTCFESFQIHLQAIMYRFEHTSHDNHIGISI